MPYCKLCDREVGVGKKRPVFSTLFLFALGLVVPLWPITLPLFWGVAFVNLLLRTHKVCGVCQSPGLRSKAPVPTIDSEQQKTVNS